jgi:hypothetical protein
LGCTGPTPRELEKDAAMENRAKELEAPTRPRLDPGPNTPPPAADALDQCAGKLASDSALERMQAANTLRRAQLEGVRACLRVLAQPDAAAAARILDFLAALNMDDLDADVQASVRVAAAARLKSQDVRQRVAAADALAAIGANGVRTEFLSAITDGERKVRWAVVRRFSDHPEELENAQLMLLAGFLGDARLASGARADVHALLLAVFERCSRGLKPEGYDPYADVRGQRAAIASWEAWARTVVIAPLPR